MADGLDRMQNFDILLISLTWRTRLSLLYVLPSIVDPSAPDPFGLGSEIESALVSYPLLPSVFFPAQKRRQLVFCFIIIFMIFSVLLLSVFCLVREYTGHMKVADSMILRREQLLMLAYITRHRSIFIFLSFFRPCRRSSFYFLHHIDRLSRPNTNSI